MLSPPTRAPARCWPTRPEKLYALRDSEPAARVARRVLELRPPAADASRRVAWTVLAHTAFERGAFDQAEGSYAEVLRLAPEKDPARNDLVERQAAAIYKQGEQARAAGREREAVGHFVRVGTAAPQSSVRAVAQYDAAATLIALKDWDGATRTLEDFRQRFPSHALQSEVGGKLALAYVEKGQWSGAAGEYERVAASAKDPQVARDALWQAAEFHEKAGAPRRRGEGLRALLGAEPAAAGAGRRGPLSAGEDRQGRRQRGARVRVDERHLLRRPERRRRPHRPHPHSRCDGGAGDGPSRWPRPIARWRSPSR